MASAKSECVNCLSGRNIFNNDVALDEKKCERPLGIGPLPDGCGSVCLAIQYAIAACIARPCGY